MDQNIFPFGNQEYLPFTVLILIRKFIIQKIYYSSTFQLQIVQNLLRFYS